MMQENKSYSPSLWMAYLESNGLRLFAAKRKKKKRTGYYATPVRFELTLPKELA